MAELHALKEVLPKRKMQAVQFTSVEECLAYLPEKERAITEYLRNIVFEAIPNCSEKLSYNVPYYRVKKSICFIWPASITWGTKATYEGVRFGFTSGNLLADEAGILEKGNRKQVYWIDFKDIQSIPKSTIKAYLHEAALLDELGVKK